MAVDKTALVEQIDQLIKEGTFSLDAITGIQALKASAEKLAKDLELRTEDRDGQRDLVSRLNLENEANKAMLLEWKKREAAIAARESKVTELEKTSAVQGAKAEAYHDILHTIFRNRQVRENVNQDVPVPMTSGSGGNSSTYIQHDKSNKDITREDS